MFSQAATPPSGTRTPRRAGTRASRAASAALQSGETTPRASPPAPSTARFGQGFGAVPLSTRGLSVGTGTRRAKSSVASRSDVGSVMEVDDGVAAGTSWKEGQDKLLVKDDRYTVHERKGLPVELHDVILAADPYTEPLQAVLDSQTGFALLVSRQYCYVWNWAKRSTSSTTYIFPLPASSLPSSVAAISPLCFASFVPSSSAQSQHQLREPGLLVISTTGLIRFWESLSVALSGVDKFKAVSATLNDGEVVRGLNMLSPTSYLVSTSQSRVLQINITSAGGRAALAVRPLERSVGWAGSVWSAVFGSQKADPMAGILALALSAPGAFGEGRSAAYAVTAKTVQVWDLPARGDGGERLVVEQDVFASVLEALRGEKTTNEDWAVNAVQAEIVDAVVETSTGHLTLLVSHVKAQTASNSLSYAIVSLNIGTEQNSVEVAGIRHLAAQSPPDPRPLSAPRLVCSGDRIAFGVFVDTVVAVSLTAGSDFEEVFPLRSNTHRFLGATQNAAQSTTPGLQTLSLLTTTASILSVHIIASLEIESDAVGSETLKTRRLKKRIEQAIYFGARDADNPLAFDLLPSYEGDLITAAEAVSAEILSSASAHLPSILDLRAQLLDRALRAKTLIEFIGSSGLLGRLSQTCRRRLSLDAERLAAAIALWRNHNLRSHGGFNLLAEAIYAHMDESQQFGDDPLRTFFRTQTSSLGKILEGVTRQARAIVSDSRSSISSRSSVLLEANQILLVAFNAVALHRRDTAGLYGLDADVLPIEPWSCKPALLEALPYHFESTDALLRERVREYGVPLAEDATATSSEPTEQQATQAELRDQMTGLAEYAFSMCEERLLFLRSGENSNDVEARQLNMRYLPMRSRFIQSLVSIGKIAPAFELAERHRDFRALVELCNDTRHGSPARIQYFMGKYAEDFAFSLYQFYVERGQYQVLLEQDDENRPLLTSFLDATDNPQIAWVNDLAIPRYEGATQTLIGEASQEASLVQKKLMLSLGKLSQIAQATAQTLSSDEVQKAIGVVDDMIDLVNTQEGLQNVFSSLLSGSESRMSPEEQGEVIASRVAPELEAKPALRQLYSHLAGELFSSRTLSAEDLVDLLTLKDNVGEHAGDFAAALEILARAEDLPDARRQVAVQSVWRRIYLRDDWASLRAASGLTDDELATTLRATALYATLAAAANAELPQTMYLEPGHALFADSVDELAARFPAFDSEHIEGLLAAFDDENRQLQEALQQHDLDVYAKEIVRLLQQDGPSSARAHGEDMTE